MNTDVNDNDGDMSSTQAELIVGWHGNDGILAAFP